MTTNPYEPSTGESMHRPQLTHADEKVVIYGQMFLRLLGVMMFVDGLAVGASSLVYGTLNNRANNSDAPFFYDIAAAGSLGNAAVYLLAGIYLMVGGNWIVEKILTPSTPRRTFEPGEELQNEDGD